MSISKEFSEIFDKEYDFLRNPNISCNEVYKFRGKYTDELLILGLFCFYFGIESSEGLDGLVPFRNKSYEGANGNNQNYDNVFELNSELKFVISIKGNETSAELRDACLENEFIIKCHKEYNEPKVLERGKTTKVPLLDFARLKNVKDIKLFDSVTISFDRYKKRRGIDWYEKLNKEHDFQHIFLMENHNNFFEEIESKIPSIRKFKRM